MKEPKPGSIARLDDIEQDLTASEIKQMTHSWKNLAAQIAEETEKRRKTKDG